MYHHVKKLMYTVRVDEADPRFGNMLLEQFDSIIAATATPYEGESSTPPSVTRPCTRASVPSVNSASIVDPGSSVNARATRSGAACDARNMHAAAW